MSNKTVKSALKRKHLDAYFEKAKKLLRPVPPRGWIHEIRSALFMTTSQLARRLGIAQSNVSIFEKSEINKKISLHSLEKIANAMDCELHYFLIPKSSLTEIIKRRVKKLYERDQRMLEHHMQLEGQGTKQDITKAVELALLEKTLAEDKRIWEDLE